MCSQQGEQGFMRAPTADELCSGCLTCLRACLPGGDEILPVRSHAQKKPIRNLVTARAQACTSWYNCKLATTSWNVKTPAAPGTEAHCRMQQHLRMLLE